MHTRIIPSSGEPLPVVGLGTWQTFDVPGDHAYPTLKRVLGTLAGAGSTVIDSSPMYGRAERVIGDITAGMDSPDSFFYATKVWTTGLHEGVRQMEASRKLMKRQCLDLIQVHNLTDWRTHLPTLRRWKEEGKTRYIGITHYTDTSHEDLERILRAEKLDFVQFNYSIVSRHAEQRLLSAAADLGVATLVNRPLGEGSLFARVGNKLLPSWAADLGITSWSAYFLKYLIGNPAVTCVIPATASPDHLAENLEAGEGPLPDLATRKKMVEYLGW